MIFNQIKFYLSTKLSIYESSLLTQEIIKHGGIIKKQKNEVDVVSVIDASEFVPKAEDKILTNRI